MTHTSNYRLMQVLLAATTLVVAACSPNGAGSPVQPSNSAPTVAAIADQSVDQDTVVGPIDFAVTDAESDPGQLKIVAASDNVLIFPVDGIVIGGSGSNRSITLTPLEQRTGSATIALLVTDPSGGSTTRTFTVNVNRRAASFRSAALDTMDKDVTDEPTSLNGFSFDQDADDPDTFAGFIPPAAP